MSCDGCMLDWEWGDHIIQDSTNDEGYKNYSTIQHNSNDDDDGKINAKPKKDVGSFFSSFLPVVIYILIPINETFNVRSEIKNIFLTWEFTYFSGKPISDVYGDSGEVWVWAYFFSHFLRIFHDECPFLCCVDILLHNFVHRLIFFLLLFPSSPTFSWNIIYLWRLLSLFLLFEFRSLLFFSFQLFLRLKIIFTFFFCVAFIIKFIFCIIFFFD